MFFSQQTCERVSVFVITPILQMERKDPQKGAKTSFKHKMRSQSLNWNPGLLSLSEPDGKEPADTFLTKIPLHLCSEHSAGKS